MVVYYSLRSLGLAFDQVRAEFYSAYTSTRNVYLIGAWLSGRFLSISLFFLQVEGVIFDVAADWLDVYNWLVDKIDLSGAVSDLVRYADDLISFIRYPFDWIADTLRDQFPSLYEITRDPVSWVLETIWTYTGLDIDFTSRPRDAIRNIVHEIVGDALDILRDPLHFVRNTLNDLIPDFGLFISDPRGWVVSHFYEAFPFAYDLLRDPEYFIESRLLSFFDDLADRYRSKVLSLAEKILQAIF